MIYRVEILTPLHIGSGYYLDRMDYICEGNWFYAISLDRLLRHSAADARELASLMSRPNFRLKEYLGQRRIPVQEVSRYRAKIQDPPSGRVHEQIKSASFYPYLPGSTVKGAIRTSMLWKAWQGESKQKLLASTAERLRDIKHQLERASNEKQKKRILRRERGGFSKNMEKVFFGRSPHYDFLRAVQVADSGPFRDVLEVKLVETYDLTGGKLLPDTRLSNWCEIIPEGAVTTLGIKMVEEIFRYSDLHMGDKKKYIDSLVQICNSRARELAKFEMDFFRQHRVSNAQRFYSDLLRQIDTLPPGSFVLSIGWGTGWKAKTVGEEVDRTDETLFREIRKVFQLGHPGAIFPKTRRLCEGKPLGWIKLVPLKSN